MIRVIRRIARRLLLPVLFAALSAALAGCSLGAGDKETVSGPSAAKAAEEAESGSGGREPIVIGEPEEPDILDFVDVFGEHYRTEILPDVPKHPYEKNLFRREGERVSYAGEGYRTRLGVDVSKYQESVDWEALREQGFDFVFIRIGYRGYGKAGTLKEDPMFRAHYEGAKDAGFDVGVYFFSQAVDAAEAEEEAELVLSILDGRELTLPVIFDPETIRDDAARTDSVTGEQFTENTIAFCARIEEAGYTPGIYSNMLWEAFTFDLTRLKELPIWYADYEPAPQTPYAFTWWQYTDEGRVRGIEGACDLDLWLIPE